MSKSRRQQNTDITRIVGILFLEVIAAIALLNLASFAQQQRTESDRPAAAIAPAVELVDSRVRDVYPYPEPFDSSLEKSLPKVAVGRYNVGW